MAINYDKLIGTVSSLDKAVFGRNDAVAGEQQERIGKSIKTMTKDLILQFPLLISEQITYETARVLAEGFERENALLVKLLLQNDLGSLTEFDGDVRANVTNVIKQIHTNIDSHPLNETSMHKECLKQLIPIEDKFNKYSLNEGTLPKYLLEDTVTSAVSTTGTEYGIHRDIVTGQDREYSAQVGTGSDTSVSYNFIDKSHSSYNPDLFEKINKIAPTMIEMCIQVRQGEETRTLTNVRTSNTTKDVQITFGVKCVVHQLKSDDIIHNIRSSVTNNTLFKIIKWTTGEFSFAKGIGEIVFDYDRMKTLGIQAAKTSNYWWFKLRKLKSSNRSKFLSRSSRVAPTKTATLLLSKEEVDFIATNYKVDLKQVKPAYKLMNDLFLLNFGYVDESTDRIYLFDEVSKSYIVKNTSDFKNKEKNKPLDIDDIKSLFGR